MCKSISVKGYSIATICTVMHKNWKPLIKDGNSIRIQRTSKTFSFEYKQRSIREKCKFNKKPRFTL